MLWQLVLNTLWTQCIENWENMPLQQSSIAAAHGQNHASKSVNMCLQAAPIVGKMRCLLSVAMWQQAIVPIYVRGVSYMPRTNTSAEHHIHLMLMQSCVRCHSEWGADTWHSNQMSRSVALVWWNSSLLWWESLPGIARAALEHVLAALVESLNKWTAAKIGHVMLMVSATRD